MNQVQIGSTVRFGDARWDDDVLVSVTNNSRDFVVMEVETKIMFYKQPGTPDGKFDRKTGHSGGVWVLYPATQPGETNSVVGGLDNGKVTTPYFTRNSKVTRILPFN